VAGNASGDTAKTLVLVGLILYIIGVVVLALLGFLLLILTVVGGILLVFAIIGFVWVALVWIYSYDRIREGDYEGARTPTLVFAILALITLGIIPGVLWLIAYVKLGDALREATAYTPAWAAPNPAPPLSPAPSPTPGGVFCSHCGRPNPPTGLFCQGCGAPLR